MKRGLIIGGLVLLVLFLAILILPMLFKDRIKEIVDQQIAQSIKAVVSYGDFDLSWLAGFPDLTLAVEQISLVGIEEFEGDTLLSATEIAVSVNPFQALFSDNLEIKSISLHQPKVFILVTEDGMANYDIAIEEPQSESSQPSSYQFGINQWRINDGSLVYQDDQAGMELALEQLQHSGSGDFSQDLFDLKTSSTTILKDFSYQGIQYVSQKQVQADITLAMDLPNSKYSFRKNEISLNDFAFGFDGWISLPENTEDMLMDITFETYRNEFQDFLSLIPGMYRDGFEDITTSGLVTLDGKAAGTYNDQQIPSFELALRVEQGMFQYPDLPTAVEHIDLDMIIANNDGNIDNTLIVIRKLHLDFGQNPIDGAVRIAGLTSPEIKADLTAALNLSELTSMFPMEGTTLKGQYRLSLSAEGTYDSVAQTFPKVAADMELSDGFIKTAEFPESLEQFHLKSMVSNSTGKMTDTRIEVSDFSFILDEEPFSGRLVLTNPADYTWNFAADGGVDLNKMTHIFPLEGMQLAGIIRGNLVSAGKLSDLEAERYNEIPTSGDFEIKDFSYASSDLPYPFRISSGQASFTPEQISLSQVKAETGSTDLGINGVLTNYINYIFSENAAIVGKIDLESNKVDLNEWMTETETAAGQETLSVLEIPTEVEMSLQARAGTVLYDNMALNNVKGEVQLKDGVAQLKNLSFNSLGGGFLVNGSYDPRDLKHPKFSMDVDMQQVGFKEAFNTFNTVKVLAPVAQFIDGDFSTKLDLNGELEPDMMPNLSTITAKGLVNIAAATLSGNDSKLVRGFSELTQFKATPKEFLLKDVIMAIKIQDGQMDVAPFMASFGDYQTEVSGSTGIDGSVNFLLNMEVPAGVVGTSVNQAISQLTGSNQPVSDKVKLNLKLSGTYDEPKFGIGGVQDDNTTAGMAKAAAEQKKAEVKDSANRLVDQETEKLTKSATQKLDSLITGSIDDSSSAEAIKEATKELLNKEKVDNVLDLFKKKDKQQSKDN